MEVSVRTLPGLALFGLLLLLQPPALAQNAPPPFTPTSDGGVTEVLQSIYIPPLVNAPFTAIVHTEWIRPLPGGGSYTLVNQRRVARDSQGRIYEERWFLVPKDGKAKSQMYVVQIADPNARTLYTCFLLHQPHACILQKYAESPLLSYTPPAARPAPPENPARTTTEENLGVQYIQGVYTTGTRVSTTIKTGVFGNDRPFVISREFWNAPSLGINLISKLSNPTVGQQTFTLSDLDLEEPDPSLFEVPAGFAVEDRRQPPPQP